MKKILIALLFAAPLLAQAQKEEAKEAPLDEKKALYSLGVALSQNLISYNFTDKEIDSILLGFSDSLKNKAQKENYDFQIIGTYINKKQTDNAKVEKEKAKDYIAKALKEKGAQKSKTGLIYIPLNKGTGKSPKPQDTVKVHYKGTFTDGKEFDSSYERKEPAEFPLGAVIPCWTEGVGKMQVGGKAKLVCPSDIAYGDMGRPPVIAGGATLVFEVELLEIKKEEPKKDDIKPEIKVKTEDKKEEPKKN